MVLALDYYDEARGRFVSEVERPGSIQMKIERGSFLDNIAVAAILWADNSGFSDLGLDWSDPKTGTRHA